ncbi:DUF748 domain-containing protein [Algisphaera agarilytica]|uniref:AsmA family protein n=1 Tax=Algisphaera agarilytica TaxID=1385975 RepID=A0A7X0LKA5_9BACT|nr:hypothetical protein [Algisphaera agarilytica]MBB6429722.1 hypothetical protein [Algisphaera agarilytica]
MKKLIVRGGLVLIALVVVGVVVLYFSLNGIIKNVVETQGTKATGVATTLSSVNLNPLGGALALSDFELASPEGFTNPSLFKLGGADVQVDTSTLPIPVIGNKGDEIVVDRVYIDGAEVVVAFENGKLNLKELLKQIEENAGAKEDKPAGEDAPAEESETKGVLIKDLKITNTKVRGEISLVPGTPPVPVDFVIANIEESDFREADTGAVIGYVIETIMLNATTEVFKQVEGLGDVVGDLGDLGVKAVEDLGGEATKAIDGVGKSLEEGLGGLLGGQKKEE